MKAGEGVVSTAWVDGRRWLSWPCRSLAQVMGEGKANAVAELWLRQRLADADDDAAIAYDHEGAVVERLECVREA